MSQQPPQDREPILSMVVDEYVEFIEQADNKPTPGIPPRPRLPAGGPVFTLEVDEMTEFVLKAIPASKAEPASEGGKKESA